MKENLFLIATVLMFIFLIIIVNEKKRIKKKKIKGETIMDIIFIIIAIVLEIIFLIKPN